MGKRHLWYLPLLIGAVIAARFLLVTPVHGIADNGDFWRVMLPAGIRYPFHPAPVQFQHVQRRFHLQNPEWEKATTSAVVPALVARGIARLFGSGFDIRFLGGLSLVVFLVSLYLLLRCLRSGILFLLLPWLALEPTLFLHFNSFYSVSLFLVLWPILLWAFDRVWRGETSRGAIFVLTSTSFLLATSKVQFLLVPALLALMFYMGRQRRVARGQFAIFLVALGTLALYPPGIRTMNGYQATFTGLGLVAQNPEGALRKLGVAEDALAWNGNSLPKELRNGTLPISVKKAADELSRLRLLWLYVTEPGALSGTFARVEEALTKWPLDYLGHFEAETGLAGRELHFLWQYSRFREALLKRLPWLLWIIPLLSLAFWRQVPMGALLALLYFTQIPVVVLGDGLLAMQRHFVVSRLAWDLMFFLFVAFTVGAIKRLRRSEGSREPLRAGA